uniref:glutathione transferase n=1 Tax=Kalanchoe fedtschenkoi TaxID=63787 RepID=A0A7N0V212_KALFE
MVDEVILLDYWPIMFCMRVSIALAKKGLQYESREADMWDKIPTLIHNGKPVCESLIAVQYIDEIWSAKAPLLPSDPHERAQARLWAEFVDKKIFEDSAWIWRGIDVEASKKRLIESLKVLEAELGDKACFGGNKLGLVDIALVTFYSCIEAECSSLVAWGRRCVQENESVAKSLPDSHKIYQHVMEMRRNKFSLE